MSIKNWFDITEIGSIYEHQIKGLLGEMKHRHRKHGESEWINGYPPNDANKVPDLELTGCEPIRRSFALFTGGKQLDIDLLGIVVECFDEMDNDQIQAALGYLNARFLK